VTDFDTVDYFTDPALVPDPHPYYDHLRAKCPVTREPNYGVWAVTGYEEAIDVLRDSDTFSSCVAVGGPFPPLPFTPEGDDITGQIAAHREQLPMHEHMVTMDPPDHTAARSLLNKLLVPSRLKENEEFMWKLADRQLDEFIDAGRCEFLSAYAKVFTLLVIADLLGVPEEYHDELRVNLAGGPTVGSIDKEIVPVNPLEWLDNLFGELISDRRSNPQDDVLTSLAQAKYPDGSTPEVIEVVRTATFLFGAGQETTAKLLGSAMQFMATRPDLQDALRADRSRIPVFVEETLRMQAPVKSGFRLAKKPVEIGDVALEAGSLVMVCPGAANRDPRRFTNPHEFDLDRPNFREHMAFGRGVHTCPGSPLARVEGRVSLERILDRMLDIRIDPEKHGSLDNPTFDFEPTFILRGLTDLHITYTPKS
jgi:cytochrome P450